MKKRILAALAATALVGVASAYAANPFADVPANSWAYQAVTTLAEQGVVIGYPDGYFRGQREITRYEMAQIIARAMAHQDRINAEQRAMLNKLADEFSTELNNLGVRVGNLEKKVGNVRLSGDARVRFQQHDPVTGANTETYDARVRLGAKAEVSDKTTVGARLVLGNIDLNNGSEENNNVTFDRLWVKHNFGGVAVTAGKQGLFLGQGLFLDDTATGVTATTALDKVGLTVGYVRSDEENDTLRFAQIGGKVTEGVDATAYYAKTRNDSAYGASLDFNQDMFWVGGEWARTKANGVKGNAWTAGVGYGNYDIAKANTWGVKARYLKYEENFAGGATTFSDAPFAADKVGKDLKGWTVNGSYALANNLGLEVDYYFHNKTIKGDKLDNNLVAQLKYQF